jgi:catechol 2,3-dioxygenase-like lactoylglutathione lyase family enzyme
VANLRKSWSAVFLCFPFAAMSVGAGLAQTGGQTAGQGPELAGIAHAAIRVSDLGKSRDFYEKLGFEEAFAMDQGGVPTQSFIKINDRQFIELYPQREASQAIGFMHVCFEAPDLEGLNRFYVSEDLKPNAVRKAGAGNLLFTMAGSENQNIEYTQYMPGSKHTNDRGKHLGAHRIAEEIVAVGITMEDPAAAVMYYKQKLGFAAAQGWEAGQSWLSLPGTPGQLVEMEQQAPGVVFQLYFSVADLRRAGNQLKALDLKAERHGSELSVLDPDGNRIVFIEAKPV